MIFRNVDMENQQQADISSGTNPRIKSVVRLKESRHRRREKMFLIDGVREIVRAIASGVELAEVFIRFSLIDILRGTEYRSLPTALPQNLLITLEQHRIRVWTVADSLFEKIAFGDRDEGIVAVAYNQEHSFALLEQSLPLNPLIGVLEGIEKPGNIGAVYRSADGAGLDGIILVSPGTDFYNPNAIRASLGTLFHLPTVIATIEETITWLDSRKIQIAAAICDAPLLYSEVDYTLGTAIVLGSEAEGLTSVWATSVMNQQNGRSIKLPMLGIADSLNISNAAAVLFYEARRQRMVSPVG